MKAVVITRENQQAIASRYLKDDLTEFPVGGILITEFGDNGEAHTYQGILSEEEFNANFTRGEVINNGFFEITRK